jgi:tetratricopeptide (TPR) repeat protein
MMRLRLQHETGGGERARCFLVQLLVGNDVYAAETVEVPSPHAQEVEGRPNQKFTELLQWYLERFMKYPFPPNTDVARAIERALEAWGSAAFHALFHAGQARDYITRAKDEPGGLRVEIASDDPSVLAWPWEALNDPKGGVWANHARLERRLHRKLENPQPLPVALPRDCINVLLVTARPYANDVQYRSVARPLVEVLSGGELPARVTLLRPPTFDALREKLHAQPDTYHILHFDGHGAYAAGDAVPDGATFGPAEKAPQGRLIFETSEGKQNPVSAQMLSELLRETPVPIVVLNACQSGMHGQTADDPFASVAAALLATGTRSALAMSYSVMVSAVQKFMPAFYRELFRSGHVTEAARRGRQELFRDGRRLGIHSGATLQDWLIPVVYQRTEAGLSFDAAPQSRSTEPGRSLPDAASLEAETYRFVGRDAAILEIERALLRKPAGILIHGLGGIGKTTLTKAVVKWLRDTAGLGQGCLWVAFNECRSADAVINGIGRQLMGARFGSAEIAESARELATVLKRTPLVLVWDNFESVRGVDGSGASAAMPEDDREIVAAFLGALRGGKTKVIITSRDSEAWLPTKDCFRVPLGPLRGEEVWEFAAEVLDDLGITVERSDAGLGKLLQHLDGHPLAMQVVLAQLDKHSVKHVSGDLERNIAALRARHTDEGSGHEITGQSGVEGQRLLGTLELGVQSLPESLRGFLIPLSLHEGEVDRNFVAIMAKMAEVPISESDLGDFFAQLSRAGLVTGSGHGMYRIHPLLTTFLRAEGAAYGDATLQESWRRGFVRFMAAFAYDYSFKALHEQRPIFLALGRNFESARARATDMPNERAGLTQALAAYAFNNRQYDDALRLYEELAERSDLAAMAYHHRGMIAQKQRDFEAAAEWYQKSLRAPGSEHSADSTYHQLGTLAETQRDFTTAEGWYTKALAVFAKNGNESGTATIYHEFGRLAAERGEQAAAREWYQKSLDLKRKLGDEDGAGDTCQQLGSLALQRRDFDEAEAWYGQAVATFEKGRNEASAARCYYQLGVLALQKESFGEAEKWHLKAVATFERTGDMDSAAASYHQLGRLAHAQGDLETARKWYEKLLGTRETGQDDHLVAVCCHELGMIAHQQNDFDLAEVWFRKALTVFEAEEDGYGKALTYHQLGMLEQARGDLDAAEVWLSRSLELEKQRENAHGATLTAAQLGALSEQRGDYGHAAVRYLETAIQFARLRDAPNMRLSASGFVRCYRRCHRTIHPEDRINLRDTWRGAGFPIEALDDEPPDSSDDGNEDGGH